jgi:hypothetical protein
MKTLMPPYTDLAIDFSYLKASVDLSEIETVFNKFFSRTTLKEFQSVEIQNMVYNVYNIHAEDMKHVLERDRITLRSTNACLMLSNSSFYLLISLGESHIIRSSITSYVKKDAETFARISPGLFTNILSTNILSMEEDEFNFHYLLISNKLALLTIDELFNFAKQVINS